MFPGETGSKTESPRWWRKNGISASRGFNFHIVCGYNYHWSDHLWPELPTGHPSGTKFLEGSWNNGQGMIFYNWVVVSICFIFIPYLVEMIQFHWYFFRWVETTNQKMLHQPKKKPGCAGYFCGDEIPSPVMWWLYVITMNINNIRIPSLNNPYSIENRGRFFLWLRCCRSGNKTKSPHNLGGCHLLFKALKQATRPFVHGVPGMMYFPQWGAF